MRIITIKFPNGDVFEVPAEAVANIRTKYYSELDGFIEGSKEWEEEFKCSMEHYELFDWVGNNMDWVDIEPYATKVKSGNTIYQAMWQDITIETNDRTN